ncbi:unnamed protein product [Vicia faba]|uniref:DUF7610 domain-containing protein n=1 Tax=Vicia faba TaxID=3906 RepID=A0AAV0ZU16_VICFA|nr:unnamed protein product [Vicia faba]
MLDDGILSGPEKYSHEDIEQKLTFVGNLVSAEAKCHPSQHLHHITEKLESLKKSFNERDSSFTTFTNPEFDKDSISNSNSSCSCSESCLKDEELDESNLIVIDDPDKLFPDFVGEKGVVGFRRNGVEEIGEKIGTFYYHDAEEFFEDFDKEKEVMEEKKELEKVKSGCGKNCCVLVSGVFIGISFMGFIMVNFSGCFDEYVEQTSFAIPT